MECRYTQNSLWSTGAVSEMSFQVAFSESSTQAAATVGVCPSDALQWPTPRHFYALGDSFSAGIGANCGWVKDEFDAKGACLKCNGSYAYQIAKAAGGPECMEVYHVGCTGASMNDVLYIGWNNRTSQLDLMNSTAGQGGWGTLSIGGNDVGFASIVANCIMFDRPSCDADMNATEEVIADPDLLEQFVVTYLGVLGTATHPDFTLIVPSYAQYFNPEPEVCDAQFLFYGRYLTREFRSRINRMVADLNLVIQVAVSIVQLQLVFGNSAKKIFYEDWNSIFEGHRFCEESPKTCTDAWFFTINGPDTLPNETIVSFGTDPPGLETLIDVTSLSPNCDKANPANFTAQMLCDWSLKLAQGKEPYQSISTVAYPWWITKTMHPKSIAHWKLATVIYEKWMNGEYWLAWRRLLDDEQAKDRIYGGS